MRALTPVAIAITIGMLSSGCTPPPVGAGAVPAPATSNASSIRALEADTASGGLIPAGYGTLRQDDIAIRLALPDVQLKLIPLDESVLRVLSADSYRALRGLSESRNEALARLTTMHNLRERRLWYATFFGLGPDARFTPTDITVTAAGREFRPVEILPLTAGFGAQRLQPRETQAALYLFEDGLDVAQPVTVAAGLQRSDGWRDILRTIDRERALIRSRAARRTSP